jgi:AbiU2
MGRVLGKQYSALHNEVAILHLYWKEFLKLFGTNQKRIDRLNQTAPGFFQMLQDELFQTNVLHIARLTDPPKSYECTRPRWLDRTGAPSRVGVAGET